MYSSVDSVLLSESWGSGSGCVTSSPFTIPILLGGTRGGKHLFEKVPSFEWGLRNRSSSGVRSFSFYDRPMTKYCSVVSQLTFQTFMLYIPISLYT